MYGAGSRKAKKGIGAGAHFGWLGVWTRARPVLGRAGLKDSRPAPEQGVRRAGPVVADAAAQRAAAGLVRATVAMPRRGRTPFGRSPHARRATPPTRARRARAPRRRGRSVIRRVWRRRRGNAAGSTRGR